MNKIKYLFFALRPKQWVKNLFIFLPLVFGKKLFAYPDNLKTLIAFFLFSLVSGVVYLVNDIIDIEKDRLHPSKRLRPIASGKIKIWEAWMCAIVLGSGAFTMSFLLDPGFGLLVAGYLVFNLLYSKILKDAVIMDVFCIAVFFLMRIAAGCVAANVQMAHWIVFMTALLALFLGFNKRRQEMVMLGRSASSHRHILIQYNIYFIDQMIPVITSSIVVCYMLFTIDPETVRKFGSNHLIFSIPFVYYGIFRYLYIIHKLKKEGDPTRILLSDSKMQLNLIAWLIVCIAVVYFKA